VTEYLSRHTVQSVKPFSLYSITTVPIVEQSPGGKLVLPLDVKSSFPELVFASDFDSDPPSHADILIYAARIAGRESGSKPISGISGCQT
jgi:hypothetical protein